MTFLNYKFGACVDTYTECHYLSKAHPQLLLDLREPLKNHFGGQANLFDSGRRQEKTALGTAHK